MSKTIEYIDKQIKSLKVVINVHIEDDFQKYNSYSDDFDEKKELLKEIKKETKRIKEEIKILKKIKKQLICWEIAKNKKVDLFEIQQCDDVEEYNGFLYYEYELNKKEFNALTKELGESEDD